MLGVLLANLGLVRQLGEMIDKNPRLLKLREVLWDRSDALNRPLPTLLWFVKDRMRLDRWLDGLSLTGMAVSTFIFVFGVANVPLILALYLSHRSLWAVGGPWFGFGWEPQLAEVGFHALFLVPLLSLNPLPNFPIPAAVQWALRWHLFPIMMGAGLIKFRAADRKWKDLTAMEYFYETQPVRIH